MCCKMFGDNLTSCGSNKACAMQNHCVAKFTAKACNLSTKFNAASMQMLMMLCKPSYGKLRTNGNIIYITNQEV